MDFTASPSDVIKVVTTARSIEPNPLALVGRFAGLGSEEQRSGVPIWAWLVLAFGAGAAATVWYTRRGVRAVE